MEQLRTDAPGDLTLDRLTAEVELSKCRLVALEAQLAQKRAEAKLLDLQRKVSFATGMHSKAVAPPLAARAEPSSDADDEDEDDLGAPAAARYDGDVTGARAGVAGGGSGTRGIDAAAAAAAKPAQSQRDVRALLIAGVNAQSTRDADEPTPHAPRAASGTGRPAPPAPRPRTEEAAGADGSGASGAAEEALRTAQFEQRLRALTAAKESAAEVVLGYAANKKPGDELRECAMILRGCLLQPFGVVFALPVDPIAYNLLDYAKLVLQPMDFTTIAAKLTGNEYADASGFKNDMELVFANCKLYNPETDVAHQAAKAGEKFFTNLARQFLARLYAAPPPAKLPRARAPKRSRAAAAAGGSSGAAGEEEEEDEQVVRAAKRSANRAAETVATARALVAGAAAGSARPPPSKLRTSRACSSPKKQPPAKAKDPEVELQAPHPPMIFKQKKALQSALQSLSIIRQARLLQFFQQTVEASDDEIEIDLDNMDNAMLWRLALHCVSENEVKEMVAAAAAAANTRITAAAAAIAKAAAAAAAASSSSSSSDSDSDSDSSSDSDEAAPPAPPAPPALPVLPVLQNADAWERFAASEAPDAAMTEVPAGETQAGFVPPELWAEFGEKEKAKQAALKARADEEAAEAARVESERVAAAAAAEAAAAAAAERERIKAAEAAEAAERARAELEERKERARAELAAVPADVDLDAQSTMMRDMEMEVAAYEFVGDDGRRRVLDTSRPAGASGGSWFTVV
jgi:hypothetical protein